MLYRTVAVPRQALDPQPGSRVVDLCAAPGGKATALAQRMGNTGTVIALERSANKVPLQGPSTRFPVSVSCLPSDTSWISSAPWTCHRRVVQLLPEARKASTKGTCVWLCSH